MVTVKLHHRDRYFTFDAGQALIMGLVTLLLIVITGLAIDGGGLLFLRRDTQSAANAALSAALDTQCRYAPTASTRAAALAAASKHGFDNNGSNNWVQVITPLARQPHKDAVEIVITAEKPKHFIGLIYPDVLLVTSHAIGQCTPKHYLSLAVIPPLPLNI